MATHAAARGVDTATHGGVHGGGEHGHFKGGGASNYGSVVLTVKSAHNMQDKAWIGKADPYCEIIVADATIATQAVKGAGEACTWDESFKFRNVAPDDVIEFHVYDKNRLRPDAKMGDGSLNLRQVFEQGRYETRIPLAARSGTKDAGELWVSLRMEEGAGGGHGAGYSEKTGTGDTERAGMETETGARREYGAEYGTKAGGYGGAHAAGTTRAEYGGEGVVRQEEGGVCGQEYFTKVEDRPVVKERVTTVREHRPVEKEFVVETRATGTEREGAHVSESLGTEVHVVSKAVPMSPCA